MSAQRKYPPELRERAVRMYRTAEPKPVMRAMARQLGVIRRHCGPGFTGQGRGCGRPGRAWARRPAGCGARRRSCPRTRQAELDALRLEVMELRRANEILRAASAYFAATLDQTGRPSWGSSTNTGTQFGVEPYSGN
jgi:transposase